MFGADLVNIGVVFWMLELAMDIQTHRPTAIRKYSKNHFLGSRGPQNGYLQRNLKMDCFYDHRTFSIL